MKWCLNLSRFQFHSITHWSESVHYRQLLACGIFILNIYKVISSIQYLYKCLHKLKRNNRHKIFPKFVSNNFYVSRSEWRVTSGWIRRWGWDTRNCRCRKTCTIPNSHPSMSSKDADTRTVNPALCVLLEKMRLMGPFCQCILFPYLCALLRKKMNILEPKTGQRKRDLLFLLTNLDELGVSISNVDIVIYLEMMFKDSCTYYNLIIHAQII